MCGGYNYTIRFRFDGRSTAYQMSLHSDVTRAADPLVAVLLTYLYIFRSQRSSPVVM